MQQLNSELDNLRQGVELAMEALDPKRMDLPLVIAADGVSAPFRAQAGTLKGKIRFQEVKIALLLDSAQFQLLALKPRLSLSNDD